MVYALSYGIPFIVALISILVTAYNQGKLLVYIIFFAIAFAHALVCVIHISFNV